ncbi:unnamed protein product [Dicrocoelium dendriticum]|nr:unnamed protein product [Dicrocoelium dendriticum]
MRPNTVCLGFFDNQRSKDILSNILSDRKSLIPSSLRSSVRMSDCTELLPTNGPDPLGPTDFLVHGLRGLDKGWNSGIGDSNSSGSRMNAEQYVSLIREILSMETNVVLARHFDKVIFEDNLTGFDKVKYFLHRLRRRGHEREQASTSYEVAIDVDFEDSSHVVYRVPSTGCVRIANDRSPFFDIWPVNLLDFLTNTSMSFGRELDRTGLFLLQLACLVARSPYWRSRRHRPLLRVFFPLPPTGNGVDETTLLTSVSSVADMAHLWLRRLLHDLRIAADIKIVTMDSAFFSLDSGRCASVEVLNELIRANCHPDTAALFLYLQKPPDRTENNIYRPMKNLLENLPDFTFTTGEMTDIFLLGLRYTSLKRSSNIVDFPVHALTLYVTQPSPQRTPSYDFFYS